jgi:phage/plasmid-like protein (TIGR03299 family)
MSANVGQMFYYGAKPWHGLGNKLPQPANLEEALFWGGLDWEVELIPIQTIETYWKPSSPVPMRKAVVRTDVLPGMPNRVLGVVHPGFKPLQNRQGAEVVDAIFGRGERIYHTGGYLGIGEVVWLLARLPAEITLAGNDIVEPYILYSNSHDGSRAIDFRLTAVRVVCQNTLNLALGKKDIHKAFRRYHSGNYESLKDQFAGFFQFTFDALRLVKESFIKLSRVRCAQDAFTQFVEALFPIPNPPDSQSPTVLQAYEAHRTRIQEEQEVVTRTWKDKADQETLAARGTWWGALNAITYYVDHEQETRGDRYAHLMFGRGDALKRKAYELAVKSAL